MLSPSHKARVTEKKAFTRNPQGPESRAHEKGPMENDKRLSVRGKIDHYRAAAKALSAAQKVLQKEILDAGAKEAR